MENKNNVTSMEEVKNKNDYKEKMKEWEKEKDEINKQLKKKDYVLTVYQTGDKGMSSGDHERQVFPNRSWVVCSLEEIPEYISYMKKPLWEVPNGLSKKEIKNYPFEKKVFFELKQIVGLPIPKN